MRYRGVFNYANGVISPGADVKIIHKADAFWSKC